MTIQVLNALGFPILTAAIVIMYRTLTKRASFLQSSLSDMKSIYNSVIETAQKRSIELEALVENQKKFNELYLKMVSDSDEHAKKINEWRKSEITLLEERVGKVISDLNDSNVKIKKLEAENYELQVQVEKLTKQISMITKSGLVETPGIR